MICPLLNIATDNVVACQGEQCAWWDGDDECCVMLSLARMPRAIPTRTADDQPYASQESSGPTSGVTGASEENGGDRR